MAKKVERVGYLGNDKRNWMVYKVSGLAPTLMAGGEENKNTNCHQSTYKIWILVPSKRKRMRKL